MIGCLILSGIETEYFGINLFLLPRVNWHATSLLPFYLFMDFFIHAKKIHVMETKQVIVMRTDLNMRKGKVASQASHASMAFLTKDGTIAGDNFYVTIHNSLEIINWLKGSYTKICVRVESESELDEIYRRAIEEGLLVHLIIDSGKTEFGGVPTKTCLAIGPNKSTDIDKITGHLKLL